MSITMMCREDAPGAVEVTEQWKNSCAEEHRDKFRLWVRTFAQGCVISLRERNGYDDSDFFATYWDEESQSFQEIEYATTRGWSYPNNATVDATPEVLARWEAHQKQTRRNQRAGYLRRQRALTWEWSEQTGLSPRQIRRLASSIDARIPQYERPLAAFGERFSRQQEVLVGLVTLLRTRKRNAFRSPFRASLAEQVWAWTQDSNPKYPTPLSRKQLERIVGGAQ